MVSSAQRKDLLGLTLLALAVFLALSLVPVAALAPALFPSGNLVGVLGALVDEWSGRAVGAGAVLLPLLPAIGGAACFGWLERESALRWAACVFGFMLLVPAAVQLFRPDDVVAVSPQAGVGCVPGSALCAGWAGQLIGLGLTALFGWLGAALALFFLTLALCIATIGWNPAGAFSEAVRRAGARVRAAAREAIERRRQAEVPALATATAVGDGVAVSESSAETDEEADDQSALGGMLSKVRSGDEEEQNELDLEDPGDPNSTERPPLSLLSRPPRRDASLSDKELDRLGEVLVDKLATLKVEGEITGRTTGPVITQFEFVPAPGIKVNKVANLDADLALALEAPSVRILAPIPGKGAVGIEVPNPQPEVVHVREILGAPVFRRSEAALPLALGKDLTGRTYAADLARMPHLLIAGATGSGKSVCINSLITSLIYRHAPESLRLLLVDPKMVELTTYGDLPHLRHPVVTDPEDAATVLKWAVLEMERRYALLSENGARSIAEFNKRVESERPLRRVEPEGAPDDPDRWLYDDGPLPRVVIIIDELADLMMAVQSEIETPLAQLAQKARAIGVHLIIATQRPSVNVVTGLIKANFPCRIAFRVSSKVDSRTILDQNGADSLLGNGDMLFLPPGRADPVRIQGAFVSTEDTERLMSFYREHGDEARAVEDDILEVVRAREAEEESVDVVEEVLEDRDKLFRQAAEVVVSNDQGSTSLLQRRLKIGYGRAARIVDQLHHAGVVGPPNGSKPRDVLVGMDALDLICEDG